MIRNYFIRTEFICSYIYDDIWNIVSNISNDIIEHHTHWYIEDGYEQYFWLLRKIDV